MKELQHLARLVDLAEGQYGLVTVAQATGRGVPPRRLDDLVDGGVLEPAADGVVRLRGGARHPHPRLLAAWLLLDPATPAWSRPAPAGGVVSHTSAVQLYGIGDRPGPGHEFTVPRPAPGVAHATVHVADVDDTDWRELHGLPVTRPGRTLVDLAVGGTLDLDELGRVADGLIRGRWADHEDLSAALDRHLRATGQRGDGAAWLDGLLAAAGRDPASAG